MSVYSSAAALYTRIIELITINGSPTKNRGSYIREAYKHVIDTLFSVKTSLDSVIGDLSDKQDTLTFDATPTNGSTNPVTSNGILSAINQLKAELINGAPEALNTFMEISAALEEDDDAFAALNNAISLRILTSSIIDALNSTAVDQPLSANQGRVLEELHNTLAGYVGNLANLNTTVKTDLVSAINELKTIAHTQNTDTKLAQGTADEVTAHEIRAFLNTSVNASINYNPLEVVSLDMIREYNLKLWKYINNTPGSGHTPQENTYWTEVSKSDSQRNWQPGYAYKTGNEVVRIGNVYQCILDHTSSNSFTSDYNSLTKWLLITQGKKRVTASTSANNYTFDLSLGNLFEMTFTGAAGSVALNFSNALKYHDYTFIFFQVGTGFKTISYVAGKFASTFNSPPSLSAIPLYVSTTSYQSEEVVTDGINVGGVVSAYRRKTGAVVAAGQAPASNPSVWEFVTVQDEIHAQCRNNENVLVIAGMPLVLINNG